MPVSLTRDEFLERLARQRKLIQLALLEDLKKNHPPVGVRVDGPDSITLVLSEEITDLIRHILIRTVELIYQE